MRVCVCMYIYIYMGEGGGERERESIPLKERRRVLRSLANHDGTVL